MRKIIGQNILQVKISPTTVIYHVVSHFDHLPNPVIVQIHSWLACASQLLSTIFYSPVNCITASTAGIHEKSTGEKQSNNEKQLQVFAVDSFVYYVCMQ